VRGLSGTASGLLVGLLAVASACGGDAAPAVETPAAPPELVIFVYDRSTSIPEHTLRLASQLTQDRILELKHGDRIAGMQLLQMSLEEAPQRWSESLPNREVEGHEIMRDSISRARFLMDANVLLGRLADPAGREDINGTDILSTLHDVAAEVQAYANYVATLYLFTDMLQSNRQIDMEGLRRMPPAGWVEETKRDGRLPDLTGLCVVVVGARVDTEAAQRVKSFWTEYFGTTGANLLDRNYVLRPVRLPSAPCS